MRTRLAPALLVLLLAAQGCAQWQPTLVVQGMPMSQNHHRFLLHTGQTVYVRGARLVGDSIIGFRQPRDSTAVRVAISRHDVVAAEVAELDGLRTGLVISGFAFGLVFGLPALFMLLW